MVTSPNSQCLSLLFTDLKGCLKPNRRPTNGCPADGKTSDCCSGRCTTFPFDIPRCCLTVGTSSYDACPIFLDDDKCLSCLGLSSTNTKKTENPSENPSGNPSENPSENPSGNPSENPSENPSGNPSENPSENPSGNPSENPSENPSSTPTRCIAPAAPFATCEGRNAPAPLCCSGICTVIPDRCCLLQKDACDKDSECCRGHCIDKICICIGRSKLCTTGGTPCCVGTCSGGTCPP